VALGSTGAYPSRIVKSILNRGSGPDLTHRTIGDDLREPIDEGPQSFRKESSKPHVVRHSSCKHVGRYLLDMGGPESSTSASLTDGNARCTSIASAAAPKPPALTTVRSTRVAEGNVGTTRLRNASSRRESAAVIGANTIAGPSSCTVRQGQSSSRGGQASLRVDRARRRAFLARFVFSAHRSGGHADSASRPRAV
jgi:hypothetical protein